MSAVIAATAATVAVLGAAAAGWWFARRLRPVPAVEPHSWVRLLREPAELADAVGRAAGYETALARQVAGRIARYQRMAPTAEIVQLRPKSEADSA